MIHAMDNNSMRYDVVIVGAGPAGLSAAIRLRQLATSQGQELRVCVLEKGSEVGAHILSGAVLEPRALNELIPDWQLRDFPNATPVTEDRMYWLGARRAWRLPVPPTLHNRGNFIISLSDTCRWLARQAEALGVEIFAGFPAAQAIIEQGRVVGVRTGEFGRGKDGQEKSGYQPGVNIYGTYTLFAEGCRGSLSQQLMQHFALREGVQPQTYGIGIKELWEVPELAQRPGLVVHSVGWPHDRSTYGGGFLYHLAGGKVAVGLITGLDYQNPSLDPFMEFQRFKTHPLIAAVLGGGKRIGYGARAINEGGHQSIPRLAFPGGLLTGCAAGFVNVAKIKGTHSAMKSGMVAAESVYAALQQGAPAELETYPAAMKNSWVYEELFAVRNIRPAFRAGLWAGMAHAALDTFIFKGRVPWTLPHHADHTSLRPKEACRAIHYEKPDGVLTFDRLSSVFLSSTNHAEDQPVHLRLRDGTVPVAHNLARYDAPEQRYCPAGVYEIVHQEQGARLQINAQNCVHCKTCDIKDPTQNITWTVPEGGGGPNYSGM